MSRIQERRKVLEEVTFIWSELVLRNKLRKDTEAATKQSTERREQ